MRIIIVLLSVCTWLGCWQTAHAEPSMQTRDFTFETDGQTLSGIIDLPADGDAQAIIIFIHGYGPTDVRGANMYAALRQRFTRLGIATVTWDKPGQGQSDGTFDINQPVHDSAREVLDAARYLRDQTIPGSENIGLWGISRAGWIAPIAMSQDPELDFWISVSGVTAEDNFFYLLMSNLPYEGSTAEETETIRQEWIRGHEILRTGGTYAAFEAATPTLRANEYIRRMRGDWYTEEQYASFQELLITQGSDAPFDAEAGQYIFVKDFDRMLSNLNADVLALLGEKDLNVDWRKTRVFYETTIGTNPEASLRIHTFPDANHNIDIAETGSIREMQTMRRPRQKSARYYDVQVDWLKEYVLR